MDDAPCTYNKRASLELERPDNDLRGADELTEPNHRRIGQCRRRRDLQPFKCLEPLGARDSPWCRAG
jgi:hypothetical protein